MPRHDKKILSQIPQVRNEIQHKTISNRIMNIIINPPRNEWAALLQRPVLDHAVLETAVLPVLDNVKQNGDKALVELTRRFDGVLLKDIKVPVAEMAAAEQALPAELKTAIIQAKQNIEKFHTAQLQAVIKMETMPGVQCWRKSIGIEKVGLYIPGGSAPLFSTVLMLGIPALLAGCKEIILCTPPGKDGNIHPAVLYAAKVAGITQIYKAGARKLLRLWLMERKLSLRYIKSLARVTNM